MPFNSDNRQAAIVVEGTFGETQGDWLANATPILVVAPDVSSLQQQNLENNNIQVRQQAPHKMVRGLKSGSSVPFQMHMTGTATNAAEAAQAVATIQTDILQAAWGGRKLGFSIGFSGGTASLPEVDADPGFVVGDIIYCVETLTGRGEAYRIEDITVLVLTLDRDLHFTPIMDDVAHACITLFGYEPALNNHAHADHNTLGWLFQGDAPTDVQELRGCKPVAEFASITAGEQVLMDIELMVTDWADDPAQVAFVATPSGLAPNVVATGCDTLVKVSDHDAPLVTVDTRGSITPNLGIGMDADTSPSGCQGVLGYKGTGLGEGGPSIIFDEAGTYEADWAAEIEKQLYIQVGNTPTAAWGIWWPKLEYRERPVRSDENGITSSSCSFRAREPDGDVSGLTDQGLGQRRAPFIVWIVA